MAVHFIVVLHAINNQLKASHLRILLILTLNRFLLLLMYYTIVALKYLFCLEILLFSKHTFNN